MESLSGLEFRRKFAQLFEINPSLTDIEAYAILKANPFNVPKTCLDIAKKTQESAQEGIFWIPKRALEQLEASEMLEKKVKLSQKSEQSQPNIIINNKLPDQEVDDSKISQVKSQEIIEIDDSDDDTKQEIVVEDDQHIAQNGADPRADECNQAVAGSKREFSNIKIFDESDVDNASSEDESDSEVDYGSQHLRSAFDVHMKSVEELKESESPKSNKSAQSFKPETRTTPLVSKIAGILFHRELRPIRINEDQTSVELGYKEYREGILWASDSAEKFLRESRDNLIECQAECRAGDSVLVQDAVIKFKVHCAVIVYLYKKDGESMAHIRYFERGCNTIIGELASPRQLFVTSRCANIFKTQIKAKIRVDFRGKGDNTGDSEINLMEEEYHKRAETYFYTLSYDTSSRSFTEANDIIKKIQETLDECECCSLKKFLHEEKHRPLRILNFNEGRKSATGFIYKGTKYQLNDFVYFILKPTSGSNGPHPYSIGHIRNIRVANLKDVKLTVDNYERYDDHFQLKRPEEIEMNIPFQIHDNRRLFRWNSKLVNLKDLDGHCFVRHIHHIDDLNDYKDLNDTFWVQDYIPHDLKNDSITVEDLKLMPEEHLTYSKGSDQRLERERKQEMNKMHGKILNTLDVFSGAGGLSQGLHESGVIGDSYAIDSDTAACEAFARNFPDAIVYNFDAGKFLEQAMKIEAGFIKSVSKRKSGKEMPSRGDIDMIVGGPPCQGWSRANRQNNPNKILKDPICPMREAIATLLCYVEFYRPKYFLLENVPGIKHHPLNGNDIPNYSPDEGPLKNGAMKFIFRVLTSLGYQCQQATLQAGAYGVPSSRTRVIIWACLPGYKLPKYPEPTNVFKSVPRNPPYLRRSAPHWPINIGDCISDLPPWEFINPHEKIQQTPDQESNQIERSKNITQYPILKNQKFVGLEKQAYAFPPLCEYQRQLRKKPLPDQLLHNHVTCRISVKQAERMCSVPLKAGADYREMNEVLLTHKLRQESERWRGNSDYQNKKLEGRYGRLSVNESFKIITTGHDQCSTNSWRLNPKLHRPYTKREIARAMGIPDRFTWDTINTKASDISKQTGNAVPPPFVRALGNKLWKVLQELEYTSRESEDDKDMIDEEIDNLIIAQLERQCNQNIDNQTDAGSEDEDEDEKNADTDDEVSSDSDLDIDGDMEDREDQEEQNDIESEDENENNWNADEEISNESEVDAFENMEGQVGQRILEFEDKSGQDLDTDERMSDGSDVDVDEDMDDRDDLEYAEEDDMNEIIDSEDEFVVNTRIQMEERINTGGSRDDAIVIDDSE